VSHRKCWRCRLSASAGGKPIGSDARRWLDDVRSRGIATIPAGRFTPLAEYVQREYFDLRDRLVANRDQEAVTKDDIKVELLANVNNATDAILAAATPKPDKPVNKKIKRISYE